MHRPRRRGGFAGVAVAALIAAACGDPGRNNEPPDPRPGQAQLVAGATAVLVRGRIDPRDLVLEPVFQTDAPPAPPDPAAGPHRLTGFDDDGAVLFDLRFAGTPVADAQGGPEEHFQFVVPLEPGDPLRLSRVELRAGDGRETALNARTSAADFARAAASHDAVTVEPIGDDELRVRWDSDRFAMVVVRNPATRRVLAMGRGGEAVVVADVDALEVIVSEGVRSTSKTVPVP